MNEMCWYWIQKAQNDLIPIKLLCNNLQDHIDGWFIIHTEWRIWILQSDTNAIDTWIELHFDISNLCLLQGNSNKQKLKKKHNIKIYVSKNKSSKIYLKKSLI